jgi:sigma-B regulation protein RsbU (phosphoserine phosphatase)
MFVTVWLGILETSTGKLTAANAGHEYPALMRAGGRFELFRDKHGFVVGGMRNIRFSQYELQLNPGDRLFVYTDGVQEATNADKELFGTDRMLTALNEVKDAPPEDVLKGVRQSVDAFVKDAEQFDDLTMLCLTYKGSRPSA